jgi:predicted phosphoribosyltransferase
MDLIGQVMSLPEYKDAPRVFVIVDNGSDHRGQAAVRRLQAAWPNAIMIHTPVHASWLNQAVRHEVACDEWRSLKGDRLMSVT